MPSERMMRHWYGASGYAEAMAAENAYEEALEAAYWRMDALRTKKGAPMSERDAFKAAVREFTKRKK